MPALLACTLLKSLTLIQQEEWRRERLAQLITQLRTELKPLRWKLLQSTTAIQPLIIGDNSQVLRISKALQVRGILIPAIRPPTVPRGTARLRISLSALHKEDDITQLATVLYELSIEIK